MSIIRRAIFAVPFAVFVGRTAAFAQVRGAAVIRDEIFARQGSLAVESAAGCASAYASDVFVLSLDPGRIYCSRWFPGDSGRAEPDSLLTVRYETRVAFLSDRGPAGGMVLGRADAAIMFVATPGGSVILLQQKRDGEMPVQIRRWDHVLRSRRGAGMANDLAVEVTGRNVLVFVNGRSLGGATLGFLVAGSYGVVAFNLEDADPQIGFASFRASQVTSRQ